MWEPQKQRFGPERIIRYIFLEGGGYVAMAKRYRDYAKQAGLFKTLDEKRKTVPAVDLLVGAVNVWCWDRDAAAWCRELRACGIERILWSNALPPDQIKDLNDLGVLTSRYDIYQDAMNPANFPQLRGTHPDWTSEAWTNDDLMIGADGQWVRGWEVETKDGKMVPCGTLCDRQAVAYAKQRIPADLATHPYRSRFIDTTTASPWRECYHPKHPMTRTESKRFKMDLLQYVSEGCGLVCGSETGHDAAVPFVHYFEGMLSLGPYRVPDSGRDMRRAWDEVPEQVAKFQTGHAYRLPLWELVYHDCVVAQWYWGDYNNKLPKLWDRRDLWNALYGTPPMFMFDRQHLGGEQRPVREELPDGDGGGAGDGLFPDAFPRVADARPRRPANALCQRGCGNRQLRRRPLVSVRRPEPRVSGVPDRGAQAAISRSQTASNLQGKAAFRPTAVGLGYMTTSTSLVGYRVFATLAG